MESARFWHRPSAMGAGPSPRCAHTATYDASGGRLLVLGGWNGQHMVNDLYTLNTTSLYWVKAAFAAADGTPKECITPRSGHTAVLAERNEYHPKMLVVFGGGDGTTFLNDLWLLDLEKQEWRRGFTSGITPCARSRHTATLLHDGRILVFGGGDDSRVYNDAYVLDIDKMCWSKLVTKPAPGASFPAPRWGHCTVALAERFVLVCGGHDGSSMLNDVWLLDTLNWQWSKIRPAGSPRAVEPAPRAGHAMCAVDRNALALFAGGDGDAVLNDLFFLLIEYPELPDSNFKVDGVHRYDYSKMPISFRWVRTPNTPLVHAPAGRCAHTISTFTHQAPQPGDSPSSNFLCAESIIVFGGGDGARRYKDLYICDAARILAETRSKESDDAAEPVVVTVKKAAVNLPIIKPTPSASALTSVHPTPSDGRSNLTPSKLHQTNAPGQSSGPKPVAPNFSEVSENDKRELIQFLQKLDMECHLGVFLREDITMETLPLLSERHLEALGVLTLGERLRLLAAARNKTPTPGNGQKTQKLRVETVPQVDEMTETKNRLTEQMKAASDRMERASVTLAQAVATLNSTLSSSVPPMYDPFPIRHESMFNTPSFYPHDVFYPAPTPKYVPPPPVELQVIPPLPQPIKPDDVVPQQTTAGRRKNKKRNKKGGNGQQGANGANGCDASSEARMDGTEAEIPAMSDSRLLLDVPDKFNYYGQPKTEKPTTATNTDRL